MHSYSPTFHSSSQATDSRVGQGIPVVNSKSQPQQTHLQRLVHPWRGFLLSAVHGPDSNSTYNFGEAIFQMKKLRHRDVEELDHKDIASGLFFLIEIKFT